MAHAPAEEAGPNALQEVTGRRQLGDVRWSVGLVGAPCRVLTVIWNGLEQEKCAKLQAPLVPDV